MLNLPLKAGEPGRLPCYCWACHGMLVQAGVIYNIYTTTYGLNGEFSHETAGRRAVPSKSETSSNRDQKVGTWASSNPKAQRNKENQHKSPDIHVPTFWSLLYSMLHCILSYYIKLYFFISCLFYSILFYSILFHSILFYSILFYSILFYNIVLYCILYCILSCILYCILYYIIFYYIILYYIILYYIILYYIILYHIILYYSILEVYCSFFRVRRGVWL